MDASRSSVVLLLLAFVALIYIASATVIPNSTATPHPFNKLGKGDVCRRSCGSSYQDCSYQQKTVCFIKADNSLNAAKQAALNNTKTAGLLGRKEKRSLRRERLSCLNSAVVRCADPFNTCISKC
eukprot:TRINITY_DN12597_c0_g1_i1.p1 TRINITY_DN12597_c0_g1~~TRINITY_DN12597_c0_g1_i1.p1  ORF type:complete len:125 (-),score=6.68 TRINITY_DN12597_c0_g1_i1:99-473(-)